MGPEQQQQQQQQGQYGMTTEKEAAPDQVSRDNQIEQHAQHQEKHGAGEKQPDQPQQKDEEDKNEDKKDDGPPGGFDETPIPKRPSGYTLKFNIIKAMKLPMADYNTMSSDPYVLAQLTSDTPTRHKEDPPLRFRTSTVRQCTDPVWNEEWIVANVPSSGFRLKLRVYDEDSADKDDRLGNVHIEVGSISDSWQGIKEQPFEIKIRSGSKRAYFLRMVSACFSQSKGLHGELYVSIENLGRTQEDGQNGRLYTVGPCRWIKHFDPMLGRLVHIKEPDEDEDNPEHQEQNAPVKRQQSEGDNSNSVGHYNFQANQLQLQGPVPAELYHRFVEFKPWVGRMFTSKGLRGLVLGKVLHHQHSRVYNFDSKTEWGYFRQGPCLEMTKQFLDLVHWDQGGRIFTYVITLDALWRFTETGKEFGIDLLSKHTMHSDVSIYIAWAGEFFIRRLKYPQQPPPPEPTDETSQNHPPAHAANPTHPPTDLTGGPPTEEPPKDPSYYQLIIDNDSGTYRPQAHLLPLLKDFLSRSLPGLHIQTLDCMKDADKMNAMKDEQRERKKKEGDGIVYTQGDGRNRAGSISSSDEEDLDRVQAGMMGGEEREEGRAHFLKTAAQDQKLKGQAKLGKLQRDLGGFRNLGGGGKGEN